MSNEIISRADASLMNLYGLQGIAETINAYADEEIKQTVLPEMAAGRKTGAMVLTEPDAGSDLQSIKVRAFQDGTGNWFVQGVKRFITNGCGDVLLVLARSEPGIADARGLSLFLVERGPRVRVRRLEEKLGIHGSPTCELFFDDAPAQLIGSRQRGLVTYVMSLMNGARVGIAAQSLVVWLLIALGFHLNHVAFGIDLPFHATFLLIAFLVVGVAIPTPGMVGGFHAFYLIALNEVYGVDRATAAAAGIAAHALGNLPVLVLGLALLGREGLSLARVAEVTRDEQTLQEVRP
jgi:hypothetical protein